MKELYTTDTSTIFYQEEAEFKTKEIYFLIFD